MFTFAARTRDSAVVWPSQFRHWQVGLPLLGLAALGTGMLPGCSTSEAHQSPSLETSEILELIQEGRNRNDPKNDVEVDLGKFRVTHATTDGSESLLLVDFQLLAVLPSQRQQALEASLPASTYRLRDAVIALVQKTDTEHLTDPSLAYFKSELVAAINRILQERLIKDVVFSDFSVHDAHNAPFPTTATGGAEKKKSSGHGH
jgi:flagellar basal body-associated protein FliL